MKQLSETPYSLLDLSPIRQGGSAAESFRNSLDLARHAERWGYKRFWVAEHHNLPGVASAATSVVIGHIAGGTSTIRVGAGGIMLPNHAPLVIAEQFGTLESLYPGRIDLGLGRAPGGDQNTARALRRYLGSSGDTFPRDLVELMGYFAKAEPGQAVRAVPGEGLDVPIWLLGSSDFSAALAAELGLPFAFASHFAPDYLHAALELYRENFKPSERLAEPLRHGRGQRVRGRHRRRGPAAVHVAAAAVPEHGARAGRGSCRRRWTAWTAAGTRRSGRTSSG